MKLSSAQQQIKIWNEKNKNKKYNAIWLGKKTVAGNPTGQLGIIFSVDKKILNISKANIIPKKIFMKATKNSKNNKIVTDVIELNTNLVPLGSAGGQYIAAFDSEFGTISFTYQKNGKKLAITCAHVATNVATQLTGNFAIKNYVDGTFLLAGHPTGPLILASKLSETNVIDEDVAVLRLANNFVVSPYKVFNEVLKITKYGSPTDDIEAIYYYNSDFNQIQCQFDRLLIFNPEQGQKPETILDGKHFYVRSAIKMNCIKGVSRPGHSGSLLYRREGNGLVASGIVFAHETSSDVWVFPMDRLVKKIPLEYRP